MEGSVHEVERLQRQGVPPIPSGDISPERESNGRTRAAGLLAAPSEDAIDAADEVVQLENQVQSSGLQRQIEEQRDWFRERAAQEAQRQVQREAEERRRQAEANAAQRLREWRDRWTQYALERTPWDVPPDIRLGAIHEVETVIGQLQPTDSERVVRYKVDVALEKALRSWRRRKEAEQAIATAIARLPRVLQGNDSLRQTAERLAGEAIAQLGEDAGRREMERAADQALSDMRTAGQHWERCQQFASLAVVNLSDATREERIEAATAIPSALIKLQPGFPDGQMRQIRDEEISRIQADILQRRAREAAVKASREERETRENIIKAAAWSLPYSMPEASRQRALNEVREVLAKLPQGASRSRTEEVRDAILRRHQEAHKRDEAKRSLIESGLKQIYPALLKLELDWEFDKSTSRLEEELRPVIRAAMEREVDGDESTEDVARIVRRLLRAELGV